MGHKDDSCFSTFNSREAQFFLDREKNIALLENTGVFDDVGL
jgi:hypothetical protein